MSSHPQYCLWFVNQSTTGGAVCVYQGANQNNANAEVLAWMISNANPSVSVKFQWGTDYDFVWFDYDPPQAQQIIPANTETENLVEFQKNQYGYYFKPPQNSLEGQLMVSTDGSIPSINHVAVGIGMHGAGTFAFPAKPNSNYQFIPVPDDELEYWISFGFYTFQENDVIKVSNMNNPAKISFPYGVYIMTAVLDQQNQWSISSGPPTSQEFSKILQINHYEAGKGLIINK